MEVLADMEYVALYRKYRPKKLSDVYGQKNIVKIVENSIKNNKFMHAYLFSGPRGTGKTTIAKLMAKIVNCENINGCDPCNECNSCVLFNDSSNPDIIEIDAASNNGVDEIRSIRDSVVLMPSVSKYKVYIIDEVHMLSTSAFNALLKTLEEPPKHVIFILATTEINKVPETIVSRCQCYDFNRIDVSDIVDCLSNICSKENVDIVDNVLTLIAKFCNGGMRDSIGLLDKLLSYSNVINEDLFYDVVGLVDNDIINNLVDLIYDKNVDDCFELVEKLVNSGKSIDLITEQLLEYLKSIIVNKSTDSYNYSILMIIINYISDIYNGLKNAFNQLLFFEVGLLKLFDALPNGADNVNVDGDKNISREIISESNLFVNNSDMSHNTSEENNEQMSEKSDGNYDIIINNAFALANKSLKDEIVNKWNGFYDYVHNKEFSSLVSYFLDSTVQVVGEKDVILSADYISLVENGNKNAVKLELLFNLVMGKNYNLVFVLNDEWNRLKANYISDIKNGKKYTYIDPSTKNNDIIDNDFVEDVSETVVDAKNIFGNDLVEIK